MASKLYPKRDVITNLDQLFLWRAMRWNVPCASPSQTAQMRDNLCRLPDNAFVPVGIWFVGAWPDERLVCLCSLVWHFIWLLDMILAHLEKQKWNEWRVLVNKRCFVPENICFVLLRREWKIKITCFSIWECWIGCQETTVFRFVVWLING